MQRPKRNTRHLQLTTCRRRTLPPRTLADACPKPCHPRKVGRCCSSTAHGARDIDENDNNDGDAPGEGDVKSEGEGVCDGDDARDGEDTAKALAMAIARKMVTVPLAVMVMAVGMGVEMGADDGKRCWCGCWCCMVTLVMQ